MQMCRNKYHLGLAQIQVNMGPEDLPNFSGLKSGKVINYLNASVTGPVPPGNARRERKALIY